MIPRIVKERRWWKLPDAVKFIQELTPHLKAAGFYPALTGSVLLNPEDDFRKDLDVVVYPAHSAESDEQKLYEVLVGLGWRRVLTVAEVHAFWREHRASMDTKRVEVWNTAERKRVDLFLLT